MKQKELEQYLETSGYVPILSRGSHIKYVKDGGRKHVLVKRRNPNYRLGAGLLSRVKRIVEVENA